MRTRSRDLGRRQPDATALAALAGAETSGQLVLPSEDDPSEPGVRG